MYRKYILLLLIPVLLTSFGKAQSVLDVNGELTHVSGKYIQVLEDDGSTMSLSDVMKAGNQFMPCKYSVPSSVPSLSAFWLRFSLRNISQQQYLLQIDNPTLDSIDLYILDHRGVTHKVAGDCRPFREREIATNCFLFHIDIPQGETTTFYLRYKGTEGMEAPIYVATQSAIQEKLHARDLGYGIYYGIILVAILYNLFLFLMIKDMSYIFYILFVLSFALLQAQLLGHSFQFLWPNHPGFHNQGIFLFSGLAGFLGSRFVRHFLQIKKIAPGYLYVITTVETLLLTVATLGLLKPFLPDIIKLFAQYLNSVTATLFSLFMLSSGIVAYKTGYRPARFFLFAWAIFLTGIAIYVLKATGILIPHNSFTNSIMQIGSATEVIMLSFALGDKYNLLKKEKDTVQREMIAALRESDRIKDEANRELQKLVAERTLAQEELKNTNKSLLKINADLDNFVYTASHDLRAPISNIEGLLNLIKSHPQYFNDEDIHSLINMIFLSVDKFKRTINDLTEITKAQKNTEEDVEVNNVKEVIEDVKFSIDNLIRESNAEINICVEEGNYIYFSRKNFRSIIYNLISNAIKYRSEERTPHIDIRTRDEKDYIVLSVKDNGLGINEAHREKIFSMFKRVHTHVEGSGIGLYIVKRIVENEGGMIELDTEIGKGSCFRIFFRKVRSVEQPSYDLMEKKY